MILLIYHVIKYKTGQAIPVKVLYLSYIALLL